MHSGLADSVVNMLDPYRYSALAVLHFGVTRKTNHETGTTDQTSCRHTASRYLYLPQERESLDVRFLRYFEIHAYEFEVDIILSTNPLVYIDDFNGF